MTAGSFSTSQQGVASPGSRSTNGAALPDLCWDAVRPLQPLWFSGPSSRARLVRSADRWFIVDFDGQGRLTAVTKQVEAP